MSAENQPIRGFKDLAVGSDGPVGRILIVNATVAGNVVLKMFDGSAHTIAAGIGYAAYPYAVRQVVSTTATATFANGI